MSFEILKSDINIDFLGMRKYAYALSAVVLLTGFLSLLVKGGPQYGIDFVGGFNVQVKFSQAAELDKIRMALESPALPGLVVQDFGEAGDHEVLLRASFSEQSATAVREAVADGLHSAFPGVTHEIQRLEMVGPKVGADLREKALQAIFYAVLLISTYISGRFEQKWMVAGLMAAGLASVVYVLDLLNAPTGLSVIVATIAAVVLCVVLRLKYALGAIVALIHDVMIPLGIFSLLNKDVDLTIIAALLTIVGYSLNDNIIIYDRIRENIRAKVSPSLEVVINRSVNQTLSRTLITAGTTFLAVFALYVFGGGVIHDFALTMLIGVVVGTYSSIFVGAPILALFKPRVDTEEQPEPEAA
ncbi:MAG: protein translocase subunit SecF [Desulfomicrobium sp.]|nr:protein translocase subunit SecF [Pseudomonadota bacterium]MBV1711033.1 protein translocase subunit SecF [Desulfomicrobium sp.]MBU4570687.1 protein translocase subunit SecF [Pseudomonadota bacterium]MBU4593451.1 protein translocase subunit SecF [Pseudomonadota bacterium]MBV1719235.1 protein translocase subunit SecF [Desulfomicrobium sp.]